MVQHIPVHVRHGRLDVVAGGLRVEIVGVGTELLLGQIANTNARWMSERLAAIGVDVWYHQVVGDNLPRVVEVLGLALERADVALVTGGLGPTEDDLTRDAIATYLGLPMIRHPEIEDLLRRKFERYGREMPRNNFRQADVPEGLRTITPDLGTAPGLIAELPNGKRIYAVPGVPAEMVEMMEGTILPELAGLSGPSAIVSRTLRCTGIGESKIAEILLDLFEASANPSVAYLASSGEAKIRLTAKAPTAAQAEALLDPLATEVVRRLAPSIFTTHDEELEEAVGRLLLATGQTAAFAESLTGGGVGRRLTSVPGSSAFFHGSAVTYTAEAKHDVLGVATETLEGSGPVSEACALEMAAGAQRIFHADIGVSFTGAAGPEPHAGEQPGQVWVALVGDDTRHARAFQAPGGRERVRRWAEQAGLDLLRRHLEGAPLPTSDRVI